MKLKLGGLMKKAGQIGKGFSKDLRKVANNKSMSPVPRMRRH